jgi:hypothetical protein
MSKLANVIVGLDELSPAELEVVAQVIALRTGTRPSSPTKERPSTGRGLLGRVKGREPMAPTLAKGPTWDVDPLKFELVESQEFEELIHAVSACSAPLVYGAGRKQDMLNRVESVKAAWEAIPRRLKQWPFRAVENSKKERSPSPLAGEDEQYLGTAAETADVHEMSSE